MRLESSPQRLSNSNQSEKQKTLKCSKKKQITVNQPGDFTNQKSSHPDVFCKIFALKDLITLLTRNTTMVVYYFSFHYQKDSTKDVFLGIFLNIFETDILKNTSGWLLLKLSRIVVMAVFFSTEAAIHKSCNKNFQQICIFGVY